MKLTLRSNVGEVEVGRGRLSVTPVDGLLAANGWSLRELYRTLETPGANRLRDAHAVLDSTVRAAYGMKANEEPLAFLLRLNLGLAEKESQGQALTPPGLPAGVPRPEEFVTGDCIEPHGPEGVE